MNRILDHYGAVYAGGTVTLLARIEDPDGVVVTPAEIESASYRIEQLDPAAIGGVTEVVGHTELSLVPAQILFSSLQTGGAWGVDEDGYNFRHEVDVSTTPAFPVAGYTYALTYKIMPITGQIIIFRFLIEAI